MLKQNQTKEIGSFEIKKQLFQHLQKQAQLITKQGSKGFQNYAKRYDREFKGPWEPVANSELIKKLQTASLVFLADFHALNQSQRTHVRLLRNLKKAHESVLLLECFQEKHQSELDQFLAGELSESQFLQKIDWEQNWGFPWENYKPLVDWALKHKVPIVALNKKEKGFSDDNLKRRDIRAAQLIKKAIHQYGADRKYIVIFGDHHLAKDHLPKEVYSQIGRLWKAKSLFVFQNADEVFLEIVKNNQEHSVDAVKFSEQKYCVQSVPPWVKWQHYLIFLEQNYDTEIEEGRDFSDWVDQLTQILLKDLGLNKLNFSYEVESVFDEKTYKKLIKASTIGQKKIIHFNYSNEISFYMPSSKYAVLARPTMNHAATLAMEVLYAHTAQIETLPDNLNDKLISLIWIKGIGYFGSKLMNPKRKTYTVNDIKVQIESAGNSIFKKSVLQTAIRIKMQEMLFLQTGRMPAYQIENKGINVLLEVAQILGAMIGEKLYYGFKMQILSKKWFQQMLKMNPLSDEFKNFYLETVAVLNGLPDTVKSKNEKL
jgi:uncharacterized iron-regulated protein